MYGYQTPDGYGDTFFIYNFNGEDIPLVNGEDFTLVGDICLSCVEWWGVDCGRYDWYRADVRRG